MTQTHPHPHSPRFRLLFWLAGTVVFFLFLFLIRSILLPFVVGMLAAYFLDPAVRNLKRRGWSRTASAASITIGFFFTAAVLCVVLVPLVSHQLSALLSQLPDYLHRLQITYGRDIQRYLGYFGADQPDALKDAVSNVGASAVTFAGQLARDVLLSGLALLNILMLIFITPVVVFYLLRDWDRLVLHFDRLLPRDHADTIRAQLQAIDDTLAGFIRGQTNVCLIMAVYYGIALSFAGLNFGLGVGIMSGILLFIPFVGFATCMTLAIVIALFQMGSGAHVLVEVLVIYGVGMVLENSIFTPRFVGDKVGLHPLWIIFGMLAGAALFGFVGVLLSVPLTAIAGVLVRFAMEHYLHSSLYVSEADG